MLQTETTPDILTLIADIFLKVFAEKFHAQTFVYIFMSPPGASLRVGFGRFVAGCAGLDFSAEAEWRQAALAGAKARNSRELEVGAARGNSARGSSSADKSHG